MRYKLAIFDFDGTLADSFPWFMQVFQELATEFDLPRRSPEEYEAARSYDTPQILKTLGIPMWKLPRVIVRMRALAARDHARIPLFSGIPEMLQKLHASGVVLALVTSNSEEVARSVLSESFARLIAHYGCGASMFGKAAKLRKTLTKAGVSPAQAIYIGDELRDATAARDARMAFGAVTWGYTRANALLACNPDAIFESPAGIPETLLQTVVT